MGRTLVRRAVFYSVLLGILLTPLFAVAQEPHVHSQPPAAASGTSASRWDFFTNFGSYLPRTHCMIKPDGTPDWPWIIASIVLNVGVLTGYLLIYRFWHRSYYAEAKVDRNPRLMYLALIFLLCATTGYFFQILMIVWPAYRLQTIFLGGLTIITWLFAWNAGGLRASFSAFRLQRELEESLRNRAAELERLVEERTFELESARLEAIRANEAKSRFVAHMSHEIRTPLTAMLGYATLLDEQRAELDNTRRHEYVETVRESGQHLLGVINDILDFSKIEAGRMEITKEPTDLRAIVESCAALFSRRADEKGLSLTLDLSPELPSHLHIDGMRCRQILGNLLGNAVKFTTTGTIDVNVQYRGRQLIMQVRDTGPGIHDEALETLFQPFTQADLSMTRKQTGTGLGLTICRKLAELMGGSVEATSKVGRGSTFTVILPADPVEPAASVSVARDALSNGQLVGRRILVAEDHIRLRNLTTMCLTKAGAEVTAVLNGEEVIQAVANATFDLILLDMQMPLKDGYATAAELRAGGFSAPIVAFTAHAFSTEKQRCFDAGCSHCVTKPFEPAEIAQTLAQFIAESKRR